MRRPAERASEERLVRRLVLVRSQLAAQLGLKEEIRRQDLSVGDEGLEDRGAIAEAELVVAGGQR